MVVTHELHYESWKHDHICPCLEVMSSTFLVWNNEMLSLLSGKGGCHVEVSILDNNDFIHCTSVCE